MSTQNASASPPLPMDTTTSSSNGDGGDSNTFVIVILVVVFMLLIIAAIALRIWCYRRSHGHWPRLFKRKKKKPSIYARPFGRHPDAGNLNNSLPSRTQQSITSHQADYTLPSPLPNKKVVTVAEVIAENRTTPERVKASQSRSLGPANSKSASMGDSFDGLVLENRSLKSDGEKLRSPSRNRKLQSHIATDSIGVYQDRTLPATLMMTTDSKKHFFAKQEANSVKRSNSATLTKPLNGKPLDRARQSYIASLDQYNDFRDDLVYKFASSGLPSRLSSKPSNTSDYVSDVEGADGRKWRKRKNAARLRAADRRKRVSDCDSAFQDCSVIENEDILEQYDNELREALQDGGIGAFESLREELKKSGALGGHSRPPFDERTESQQNTLRSDAFASLLRKRRGEESPTENQQSSDTESMAESYVTRGGSRLSSLRNARQYDSDGGVRLNSKSKSSQKKTKSRRRVRRARSDSSRAGRRRRSHSRDSKQTLRSGVREQASVAGRRTQIIANKPAPFDHNSDTANAFTVAHKSKTTKHREKPSNDTQLRKSDLNYQTSSLRTPINGTVIEMPIYSQATWSGPGSTNKRKHKRVVTKNRLPKSRSSSGGSPASEDRRPRSARTCPRPKRTGRKLSIGGGGRFFYEYDTLPVDLSKLPPELLAKIGGEPDRLLEPLDKLNFDKLCRPLPTLGEAESQLSARRLMSEKLRLPPDHRDREILSNTYELEDTGLVMTDL